MRTSVLLAAAGALALVSCANTGDMGRLTGEKATFSYADYAGMPVEGFQSYRINGWTPVSRTQLVVWTGVNDAYLIRVWDTCQNLQFAENVGVTSTSNRVTTFEKVRVGRDTCPISEIRPVDIKSMRADRKAAADAARTGQAASRP